MINNDILRRLRFALDLDDKTMIKIFSQGGASVSQAESAKWLLKDEEEGFVECPHDKLSAFLDGLVLYKRGPKPGEENTGVKPLPRLTNNQIMKKIRIALELREEDLTGILALAGLDVSKNELSAIFRKPDHRNYRECRDQFLRNFLNGLSKKYRGV